MATPTSVGSSRIQLDTAQKRKIFRALRAIRNTYTLNFNSFDLEDGHLDEFLTEKPSAAECVKHVSVVELDNNNLTSLPAIVGSFEYWEDVRSLSCRNNKLTHIDGFLSAATDVRKVILCGNLLQSLPESLYQLNGLQVLDLSDNKLESLPEWFGNLSESIDVRLHDNPFADEELRSVADSGSWVKVRKYLRSSQPASRYRPNQEQSEQHLANELVLVLDPPRAVVWVSGADFAQMENAIEVARSTFTTPAAAKALLQLYRKECVEMVSGSELIGLGLQQADTQHMKDNNGAAQQARGGMASHLPPPVADAQRLSTASSHETQQPPAQESSQEQQWAVQYQQAMQHIHQKMREQQQNMQQQQQEMQLLQQRLQQHQQHQQQQQIDQQQQHQQQRLYMYQQQQLRSQAQQQAQQVQALPNRPMLDYQQPLNSPNRQNFNPQQYEQLQRLAQIQQQRQQQAPMQQQEALFQGQARASQQTMPQQQLHQNLASGDLRATLSGSAETKASPFGPAGGTSNHQPTASPFLSVNQSTGSANHNAATGLSNIALPTATINSPATVMQLNVSPYAVIARAVSAIPSATCVSLSYLTVGPIFSTPVSMARPLTILLFAFHVQSQPDVWGTSGFASSSKLNPTVSTSANEDSEAEYSEGENEEETEDNGQGYDEEEESTLFEARAELFEIVDGTPQVLGVGSCIVTQFTKSRDSYLTFSEEGTDAILAYHTIDEELEVRPDTKQRIFVWKTNRDQSRSEQPTTCLFKILFQKEELAAQFYPLMKMLIPKSLDTPVINTEHSGGIISTFTEKSEASKPSGPFGFAFTKPSANIGDNSQTVQSSVSPFANPVANLNAGNSFFNTARTGAISTPGPFTGFGNSTPFGTSKAEPPKPKHTSFGGLPGSSVSDGASEASDSNVEEKKRMGSLPKGSDDVEAEPDVHFEPILKLEEVAVETGEDDEDVLFEAKAKLYRFVDGQWKERGTGPAKLLKHKQSGAVRFLLRRDATLKIASNHRIASNMELKPDTNKRVFSWVTPSDFVDGESTEELFKIRFRTDENAEDFKTHFERSVVEADEVSPSQSEKESPEGKKSEVRATVATNQTPEDGNKGSFKISPDTTQGTPPVTNGQTMKLGVFGSAFGGAGASTSEAPKSFGLFGQGATIQSGGFGAKFGGKTGFGSFEGSTTPQAQSAFSGAKATTDVKIEPLFGVKKFDTSNPGKYGTEKEHTATANTLETPKMSDDVEAEPDVYFEPIVQLKEVEVDTGEGDENVLFEARAKLYRYVDDQWKERGTGPAKLLKHRESGAVRFLLRRDTTHKIASNHRIICDMKLKPDTNERIFSWMTPSDFVDGESSKEMFKIRFRTDEAAAEFKAKFEESIANASRVQADVPSDQASEDDEDNYGAEGEEVHASTSPAKPSIWGVPSGDKWECQGCLCTNKGSMDVCPACGTGRDGSAPAPEVKAEPTITFNFGVPPSIATSATDTEPPKKTGLFGSTTTGASAKRSTEKPSFGLFSVGTTPVGSGFGGAASIAESGTDSKPVFGVPNEPEIKPSTGAKVVDDVEAEPNVHFEPLVELEEVEVNTGEDDEDVLFEARAKLYRFVDNQWKERGTGPAKLLKHKESGGVRFLLRRDTTLKIASNHRINSNMELKADTNERIFSWMTPSDFVDGESSKEMFKIRFRTDEAAAEFKTKFEASVANASNVRTNIASSSTIGDAASTEKKAAEPVKDNTVSRISPKSPAKVNHEPAQLPQVQTKDVKFGAGPGPGANADESLSTPSVGIFGYNAGSARLSTNSFGSTAPVFGSTAPAFGSTVPAFGSTAPIFGSGTVSPFETFGKTSITDDSSKPSFGFFGKGAVSGGGFGGVATSPFGGTANTDGEKAAAAPQPLFAPKAVEGASSGSIAVADMVKSSDDVEAEPDVYFEPVVTLEEVEVNTGEDDEDVLFEARAKLYRFVGDQWKERGTGPAKLLKHKQSKAVRFLLRRDTTHKIASNHRIIAAMKLTRDTNERVISWMTPSDFVDGESTKELFKIRFRTDNDADNFKTQFEKCVSEAVLDSERESTTGDAATSEDTTVRNTAEPEVKDDSDDTDDDEEQIEDTNESAGVPASKTIPTSSIWGAPAGDKWSCEGCLCTNPKSEDVCPACGMGKDGSAPVAEIKKVPVSTFSFGIPAPTTDGIHFGGASKGFSTAPQPVFGVPVTTNQNGAKSQETLAVVSGNTDDVEAEPDVYFEPVVTLKEVETQTGEEDEDVLFLERAKLHMKVEGAWKERGVGIARMLRHRSTGAVRFLMRREATHKICANHTIPEGLAIKPADNPAAAYWIAPMDASDEGEPQRRMFSMRLKTEEQMDRFRQVFEAAAKGESAGLSVKESEEDNVIERTAANPAGECKSVTVDGDNSSIVTNSTLNGDGATKKDTPETSASNGTPQFKPNFGVQGEPALSINTNAGSVSNSTGSVNPPTKVTFGKPMPGADPFTKPNFGMFNSTLPKSGFGFGGSSNELASVPQPLFGNTGASTATGSDQKSIGTSGGVADDKVSQLEDEPDVHFEPIVTLEEVAVETGEDDEDVLFEVRARLYRFVDDQWKERGTGPAKLLKHKQSGAVRFLLRRDKTLKISSNHRIISNMELKLDTNERVFSWVTPNDFVDGVCTKEIFKIRFKTDEAAAEFKAKFEESVTGASKMSASGGDSVIDALESPQEKSGEGQKDSNNVQGYGGGKHRETEDEGAQEDRSVEKETETSTQSPRDDTSKTGMAEEDATEDSVTQAGSGASIGVDNEQTENSDADVPAQNVQPNEEVEKDLNRGDEGMDVVQEPVVSAPVDGKSDMEVAPGADVAIVSVAEESVVNANVDKGNVVENLEDSEREFCCENAKLYVFADDQWVNVTSRNEEATRTAGDEGVVKVKLDCSNGQQYFTGSSGERVLVKFTNNEKVEVIDAQDAQKNSLRLSCFTDDTKGKATYRIDFPRADILESFKASFINSSSDRNFKTNVQSDYDDKESDSRDDDEEEYLKETLKAKDLQGTEHLVKKTATLYQLDSDTKEFVELGKDFAYIVSQPDVYNGKARFWMCIGDDPRVAEHFVRRCSPVKICANNTFSWTTPMNYTKEEAGGLPTTFRLKFESKKQMLAFRRVFEEHRELGDTA
ncbi:hypothetical protein, variant [Sphaeroforma arctica JP610]|uniref:Ran-specific GTPase-activating protein n=1 Tax=Sphaeroforma arctica JP610 TaxID=667725 RepID=A0A0L0GFG6_9EUKA|nr:hypothetical protein, variant [Sphaeroforma arctica JP610]KNC87571.1 hypothetical protein, variant [Sphaeroforma arctica JP610]|eukprot:XP_014161473.1 hypothetical protein, variant [Sphaeroforma arctica JP610]